MRASSFFSHAGVMGLVLTLLAGCAVTSPNMQHPLIESNASAPFATVYFLRPYPERVMGYADNPVNVQWDGQKLLTLGKGEYTTLHLKPRSAPLTLRSESLVGPHWTHRDMVHSRMLTVEAGKTYYLLVQPIDGEFRGVYFIAEAVERHVAQAVSKRLRPSSGRVKDV